MAHKPLIVKSKKNVDAEAKRLGISHGMYVGFRDSGYLETYERIHAREVEEARTIANRYQSYIGSGNASNGTVRQKYGRTHIPDFIDRTGSEENEEK